VIVLSRAGLSRKGERGEERRGEKKRSFPISQSIKSVSSTRATSGTFL